MNEKLKNVVYFPNVMQGIVSLSKYSHR